MMCVHTALPLDKLRLTFVAKQKMAAAKRKSSQEADPLISFAPKHEKQTPHAFDLTQ